MGILVTACRTLEENGLEQLMIGMTSREAFFIENINRAVSASHDEGVQMGTVFENDLGWEMP
mgnify:FL=1